MILLGKVLQNYALKGKVSQNDTFEGKVLQNYALKGKVSQNDTFEWESITKLHF